LFFVVVVDSSRVLAVIGIVFFLLFRLIGTLFLLLHGPWRISHLLLLLFDWGRAGGGLCFCPAPHGSRDEAAPLLARGTSAAGDGGGAGVETGTSPGRGCSIGCNVLVCGGRRGRKGAWGRGEGLCGGRGWCGGGPFSSVCRKSAVLVVVGEL
jgi:hypothetical protein